MAHSLGETIPAYTSHAVSVSLPKWRDNVDYEEGEARVLDSLKTGYPRFFIHKSIQKLNSYCQNRFGVEGESCLIFPTPSCAQDCQSFVSCNADDEVIVKVIEFTISCPRTSTTDTESGITLHVTLFPTHLMKVGRQYWQHTGAGISSRLAERCLIWLDDHQQQQPDQTQQRTTPPCRKGRNRNRFYSAEPIQVEDINTISTSKSSTTEELEHSIDYLEERYGRNLTGHLGKLSKSTLKRRIADAMQPTTTTTTTTTTAPNDVVVKQQPLITADDVFLYPCGMSAIYHSHRLLLRMNHCNPTKSVCFGFPYTDTLKVLQKWGPGCHFFGHGLDADLLSLQQTLQQEQRRGTPIQALFCEFPSNPLLRSPNIRQLRTLADQFNFIIVVDETIGSFVNIDVLPWADIVVSSLTKVFSGDSNVMGGSLCLSPHSRHYQDLKTALTNTFEDMYFEEDAVYMERNSRDFQSRVERMNDSAQSIAAYLRTKASDDSSAVKDVFYPHSSDTEAHYNTCMRQKSTTSTPGYGGLLSVTFQSLKASEAFYDALECHKGPSLGTNFTMACPFVVLAHYNELDWAASFGVEVGLVRISIGLESTDLLLQWFKAAIEAADLCTL